jgi:hypothetical protein
MSQDVLRQRAAKVRQNWSRNERRQRAVASDIRCLELIIRLATGREYRPAPVYVKTSA